MRDQEQPLESEHVIEPNGALRLICAPGKLARPIDDECDLAAGGPLPAGCVSGAMVSLQRKVPAAENQYGRELASSGFIPGVTKSSW